MTWKKSGVQVPHGPLFRTPLRERGFVVPEMPSASKLSDRVTRCGYKCRCGHREVHRRTPVGFSQLVGVHLGRCRMVGSRRSGQLSVVMISMLGAFLLRCVGRA